VADRHDPPVGIRRDDLLATVIQLVVPVPDAIAIGDHRVVLAISGDFTRILDPVAGRLCPSASADAQAPNGCAE